jgi:peptide deformylase
VLLKIQQAGNPVLRQRARALERQEILSPDVQRLIEDMRETMRDAPGVGLAAPQVGLGLQLAVIEDRAELMKELAPEQLRERQRQPVPFFVIINPRITFHSGGNVDFFEGCLSIAGYAAIVPRARRVRVDYLDQHGDSRTLDVSGWQARILQHEIDHLEGVLYIDRMHARSFSSLENLNRHWKNAAVSEVLRQVGHVAPPQSGDGGKQ